MINTPPVLTIATYSALLLTVAGLWHGPRVWVAAGATAVALGYASGTLAGSAVLWLLLLAGACLLYAHFRAGPPRLPARFARLAGALGIVALGALLGMHALPGFHNLLVARNLALTPQSAPYTLYLNFDKTMAGVLLLGALQHPLIRTPCEWARALRGAAPVLVPTVTVLTIGSLALGYVRVDPKWHVLFWIWAPANLLMTCLSEEAFFRGFIQREVHRLLAHRSHADAIAIGVGALTFGAAHLGGGVTYALLATIAGTGYGYVYARTGRIEMAMLTHFALNATHFLLFTYPRVAA